MRVYNFQEISVGFDAACHLFAERSDASCVKKDWATSHSGAVRGLMQKHTIIPNVKFFPVANAFLLFVVEYFFVGDARNCRIAHRIPSLI